MPVPKPTLLESPNLDMFRSACEDYINNVGTISEDRLGDVEHFIFEKALEALYGPGVWVYVIEQIAARDAHGR
jgi:hypothetical protein